jgi:hypothetical protein
MEPNITSLERAFQLAQTGQYGTVETIKRQLSREGYSASQIEGGVMRRQLKEIIGAAIRRS